MIFLPKAGKKLSQPTPEVEAPTDPSEEQLNEGTLNRALTARERLVNALALAMVLGALVIVFLRIVLL